MQLFIDTLFDVDHIGSGASHNREAHHRLVVHEGKLALLRVGVFDSAQGI